MIAAQAARRPSAPPPPLCLHPDQRAKPPAGAASPPLARQLARAASRLRPSAASTLQECPAHPAPPPPAPPRSTPRPGTAALRAATDPAPATRPAEDSGAGACGASSTLDSGAGGFGGSVRTALSASSASSSRLPTPTAAPGGCGASSTLAEDSAAGGCGLLPLEPLRSTSSTLTDQIRLAAQRRRNAAMSAAPTPALPRGSSLSSGAEHNTVRASPEPACGASERSPRCARLAADDDRRHAMAPMAAARASPIAAAPPAPVGAAALLLDAQDDWTPRDE
jgi:hypothetical protein